jgi:hypothetical protein
MTRAVVGVLFVVLGYQLRYRKRYRLIAGYDPRRTKNPEPIARMLGGVMLVSGVCQIIVAVGSRVVPGAAPWLAVNAAILLGTLLAIVIGSVRLHRQSKIS